jgi:CelD/BcsL family acetyltransferase involved in cellulose biosynthesis
MISFERLNVDSVPWRELDGAADRTVFQTRAWLRFVERTQRAETVVARVYEGGSPIGYFTGLITKRFGLKILGSPLKGWTTHYMGFNLPPGTARRPVLEALPAFAFDELRCHYLELMDPATQDGDELAESYEIERKHTYHVDLTQSEEDLLGRMGHTCRRTARRPERTGVTIEEATDLQFADDYFAQLRDVFSKQRLVPTYGVERVRELIRCLTPGENLLLLRARNAEGTCIATGIFPAFGNSACFWGGASWRASQKLYPNEPLMWYAMRYWKARGVKTLDFGGGGAYKEKFGPNRVKLTRFMRSRLGLLISARHAAKRAVRVKQILRARLARPTGSDS